MFFQKICNFKNQNKKTVVSSFFKIGEPKLSKRASNTAKKHVALFCSTAAELARIGGASSCHVLHYSCAFLASLFDKKKVLTFCGHTSEFSTFYVLLQGISVSYFVLFAVFRSISASTAMPAAETRQKSCILPHLITTNYYHM